MSSFKSLVCGAFLRDRFTVFLVDLFFFSRFYLLFYGPAPLRRPGWGEGEGRWEGGSEVNRT